MAKRALVVDNDFFFVEFLSELLEKRGYDIIKAYDGKEGISKLEEGSVDLFFVDMVMPKIDGRQFIKFIRKQFPDARFPIVAVSGTLIEELDMINEFGADFYIAKGPMETMASIINNFMDKIEKESFPFTDDQSFLNQEKLYPREATVELLDNLNFARAVIENIGVGVIVVDMDARIIYSNSLALGILNKPFEAVLNCQVTNVFPEKEEAKLVAALKGVIQNQEITKSVFPITIDDQEIRVVVSVLNLKSKVVGWIIAMEETG